MKEKMSRKTAKALKVVLVKTGMTFLIVWASFAFAFGVMKYKGDYMYPALYDGDIVVTFRLEKYRLGDVVAYKTENGLVLARIAALPGSVIDEDNYGYTINGSHPTEKIFYQTKFEDAKIQLPYNVPDDSYLLLNDMRDDSNDSRKYGAVKETDLKGKIIYIFRKQKQENNF
jgi:signal peptidase I